MLYSELDDIYMGKSALKQLREENIQTITSGVTIIVPTFKEKFMSNIFENYNRSNYPVKELIIVLNNDNLNLNEYQSCACKFNDVKVFRLNEENSLGACLNFGINNSKYNYISRMDDDDFYGANYLTDLMNVFNYADAQITGKNPVFVYFEDNTSLYQLNHDNCVMGATILFKKDIHEKIKFRDLSFREDYYFISDCIKAGVKVYPSDIYNYVYIRHSDLSDHTFRCSSEEFIKTYDMQKILTTKDFSSIVTA